ncbi:MAG: hypothetical protein QOE77_2741 [Blastocatellia bacterium]|jgi:hypothetical protein|nr:hypothetical protein [Blastocatellia bacterium]
MPEFEPDEESISRANLLSSQLMDDLRTVSEEGPRAGVRRKILLEDRYLDRSEGEPIADVVEHLAQMAMEFAVLRRWEGQVLCIQPDGGAPIPISLHETLGDPTSQRWYEDWLRPSRFSFRRSWRDVVRQAKDKDIQVRSVGLAKAQQGAQLHLAAFLSYRFSGLKMWAESMGDMGTSWFGGMQKGTASQPTGVGPGGTLQVQVSCRTLGLRLHVSPAFFISWTVFGHPTGPVSSHLLPGRYIFAGDGPMLPKRKRDPGIFSIPPTFNPALTRF